MIAKKEALIVRTLTPSVGYAVHVETWDERGHDNTGWTHRELLNAQRASDEVVSLRSEYECRGYDVDVTDREVSAS
ncbi:hypothetical protein OKC48_07455 [Methylorubrum extorquens]|uniref:hypothetical protein n=1 Tax=Methylorubrum extorquens TaxID=408 RepID=UPI002237B202|nr:hypothetical protein [Methylorubrum extorquens]UYW28342.1 hypothetical protein OKC48_07455 [Methylorubrum extorquens]